MKLADLERHLRQQGCVFLREGGAHTVWFNPQRRKITSVPRHLQITRNSPALKPGWNSSPFALLHFAFSSSLHLVNVISLLATFATLREVNPEPKFHLLVIQKGKSLSTAPRPGRFLLPAPG
jgi:mRNA interferase HicA